MMTLRRELAIGGHRLLRRLGIDIVRHRPDPTFLGVNEGHLFSRLGIRTVVDVGAHRGEFAELVLNALPGCSIISFEPLAGPYADLEARLRPFVGCDCYNLALGDAEGVAEMHRNEYTMSSSLLDMHDLHKQAFPFTRDHSTLERVRVARMDDVLSGKDLTAPLLVKVDVQGYEDRVFAGASETLAKANAILCEVSFAPLYVGQPLFGDIHGLLRNLGFRFSGLLGQLCDPRSATPLQGDALFLRV